MLRFEPRGMPPPRTSSSDGMPVERSGREELDGEGEQPGGQRVVDGLRRLKDDMVEGE